MCRELTKLHEEVRRGPLATLAHASAEHETRGEFVLVIAPPTAARAGERGRCRCAPARSARAYLAQGCGGRSRGRNRIAATDALSAGARADGRKRPGGRVMARRAQPLRPPSAPKAERVAAFRLGLSAESRAAMFLIAKGYRILARRFKTPFGEIDIVARRRGALVFVEVKARGRADEAAEAVTGRGKQRIVAAAELWLARNPADAQQEIRFDVVLVTPGKLPQHIPNAFEQRADCGFESKPGQCTIPTDRKCSRRSHGAVGWKRRNSRLFDRHAGIFARLSERALGVSRSRCSDLVRKAESCSLHRDRRRDAAVGERQEMILAEIILPEEPMRGVR